MCGVAGDLFELVLGHAMNYNMQLAVLEQAGSVYVS